MTVEKWSYPMGCALMCLVVSAPAQAVPANAERAIAGEIGTAAIPAADNPTTNTGAMAGKAPPLAAETKTADAAGSKSSVSIPEPSNLLMLALGVAGLITGRLAARRRRKKA